MSEQTFVHDHTGKLVRMANQIGAFFESQPPETVETGIADHIAHFWDKRMRREIYAYIDRGGEGLHKPVVTALQQLRTQDKASLG